MNNSIRYLTIIMANRVLILGGYGNFGRYISRALLKDSIPIILAGRNQNLLNKQKQNLINQCKNQLVNSIRLDIDNEVMTKQCLRIFQPKVVINTCGPFQTANYKIVENFIEAKVNYIDLADGRQFVNSMKQFHEKALKNNTTVITGASSVPGLSSAVIEQFQNEFKRIDKMQYGISPGQKTNRGGVATIRGVMSYIGKPIAPYGELKKPIYGWQNIYAEKYPQLGYRLFGNCQVPDLDIFPEKYGIKNLRFSAGTQNHFLHICIWLTSWLIRLGLPLNLPKHAQFLWKLSHMFDPLGTMDGGMHVTLTGINKQNKPIRIKWYIIVRSGHGPNVPIIPAIILAKKMYQQKWRLPGVHPCAGLVTLQEYLDGLGKPFFSTYVQRENLQQ